MTTKKPSIKYKGDPTQMSFYVPAELKNAFKAKTASQGKTLREVMVSFMADYVKEKNN